MIFRFSYQNILSCSVTPQIVYRAQFPELRLGVQRLRIAPGNRVHFLTRVALSAVIAGVTVRAAANLVPNFPQSQESTSSSQNSTSAPSSPASQNPLSSPIPRPP